MAIPDTGQDKASQISNEFRLPAIDPTQPKKRGWLWILILIVLAGGGYYYYKSYYVSAETKAAT